MSIFSVAWVYLGVSCCSFLIQFWKLFTLLYQWPATRTQNQSHTHRGLIRTSICRVIAAIIYVAVGIYTLRSQTAMTAFSLEVFAGIQFMWILNAFADVRLWQFLENRIIETAPPELLEPEVREAVTEKEGGSDDGTESP